MNLPSLGDVLHDRYRLEAILGDGGFGTVFRATDLQTRTLVAVKVLHPDDGDRYLVATQRRFEREVAILSQLQSEHTVRLLSYGSTPSRLLYLVFEYLPGRDLSEVLRDGPLPPSIVEHILRQVLAALADAHRAGLTHRDIKPANIRVMQVGRDAYYTKLIDFGIARSVERDRVAVTKTGELIGTPRYMSPEQLRENELTAASDIYSLGVVGVEMLAGSGALLDNGLGAQLERLQPEYQFGLPPVGDPRLAAVIHRMTASAVEGRYRTVGQALDALDGRAPAAPGDPPQTVRAPPVAAIFALMVVVGLGAGYLTTREDEPEPPAVTGQAPGLDLIRRTPDAAAPPAPPAPPVPPRDMAPELPELEVRACNTLDFRGMGRIEDATEGIVAYVPDRLDQYESVPLVVVLHGRYDEPDSAHLDEWLERSGLVELAEKEGFAIIAPRDEHFLYAEPWEDEVDLAKVKHWVDRTTDDVCVDPTRVFIVAQSDASVLFSHLRCADWVTAMGSNGSRLLKEYKNDCSPKPTLRITPRDTKRMPEAGGSRCPNPLPWRNRKWRSDSVGLADYEERLRGFHKCSGAPTTTFEDETGRCVEWTCKTRLRFCTHEGGEPWPGTWTTDECAGEAPDFPTAAQMWAFFKSVPPLNPK